MLTATPLAVGRYDGGGTGCTIPIDPWGALRNNREDGALKESDNDRSAPCGCKPPQLPSLNRGKA